MSRGLNKCQVIGNIGNKAEIKNTRNNTKQATFSVAVSEAWKDKATGEKREHTEWVKVVAYGVLSDIIERYTDKGSKIYVEGKMQTRKYQKNGEDRYITEIVAKELILLPSGGQPVTNNTASHPSDSNVGNQDFDDPIPF